MPTISVVTASRSIWAVLGVAALFDARSDGADLVLVPSGAGFLAGGVEPGQELNGIRPADLPGGDRPELGQHGVGRCSSRGVGGGWPDGRMVEQ
jgi:hypothetical protein